MKIETTNEKCSLEMKRCYLPIVITDDCPTCGATVERHLANNYLSFPKVNEPFEVTMYHCIEKDGGDEEHE